VFTWEPGVMWRENRDYAITVQGDIVEGPAGRHGHAATAARAAQDLEAKWPPQGRTPTASGGRCAVEESSKGSASIAVGVPIMLFITFTLLMLQLQQLQPGHAGVPDRAAGHCRCGGALLLFDRPFGFVALLGVIALMGMIQRNSVILIDQIEQDRAQWASPVGRHRGERRAAAAADRADRRCGRAGHDPAVAQRFSGARWPWRSWAG
jgi:multidrug efflux pump